MREYLTFNSETFCPPDTQQDSQCTHQRNTETRSCNHCCSGEAITIIYSECVCSLRYPALQCACAILSPVASTALHYFSTLSHKRHYFREKMTEYKIRFFSPQVLCETFLILRRTERDMTNMFIGLHVKCRLFLSDCNET